MGYDPQKARIATQLLAQGLPEEQALAQAGISPNDYDFYAINAVPGDPNEGSIGPSFSGPPRRPNEIIVPPGANIDDDEEDIFAGAAVTSQSTTTQQTSQVTGGSVRTTTVTPTTYKDTAQSSALKGEADALQAQKEARAAELRAQGKTGAEVLRDPQYRALSREAQAKEYAAQDARAVDQAGTVSTTTSPGQGEVFQQTPNSQFLTDDTAGDDPQVNLQDANRIGTSGERPENTSPISPDVDPYEVDGAGIGLTDEEILAQDNPQNFEPIAVDDAASNQFVFDEDGNLIPADSAEADRVRAIEPTPPLDYSVTFEEGFDFVIVDDATGSFVETGFATQAAAAQRLRDLQAESTGIQDPSGLPGDALAAADADTAAARQQATLENARQQATIQSQRKQGNDTDWRVRLSLAPQSTYLYNAPDVAGQPGAGILAPLRQTNGVIFPYTPRITTAYVARYNNYDLTHSNYRGYFYQGSHLDDIQIEATFTAQDTAEAEYLLAVIHFFRSVTKMFYGQDAQRGTPPPLVYLRGLGEFQYNLHPCVVSQFNYNLPNDVDYIRARSKNTVSGNLLQRRQRQSVPTNVFTSAWQRLTAAGIPKGAEPAPPPVPVLGTAESTYVPTKLDISLVLKPMQSREEVSRQFSLRQYANGDLLKGGFW